MLNELINFEIKNSDPRRFTKDNTNMNLLKEGKFRAYFNSNLKSCSTELKSLLISHYKKYNDIICYNGRSYISKMDVDVTEMLYMLEEQRVKIQEVKIN